jgi:hypothetical protein
MGFGKVTYLFALLPALGGGGGAGLVGGAVGVSTGSHDEGGGLGDSGERGGGDAEERHVAKLDDGCDSWRERKGTKGTRVGF